MHTKTIDLKTLSNKELLTQTQQSAVHEKQATYVLILHLSEIQVRRLYAEIGYSSLWEYAVKELGYSESAAAERCNAMRLCFSLPEAQTQVKEGLLSLTSASKVQRFIYAEKKRTGKEMDSKSKQTLLKSVIGKSTREIEKVFLEISPTHVPRESDRYAGSGEKKVLNFSIDEETIQLLDRFRELRGTMSLSESFKLTLKHYISKNDPLLKKEKVKKHKPSHVITETKSEILSLKEVPESRSNTSQNKEITWAPKWKIKKSNTFHNAPGLRCYKNISVKSKLHKKAGAQCTYISTAGRRCSSKTKLQTDHKVPLGKNGDSRIENLRILCPEHNRLAAIKEFGAKKMNQYFNDHTFKYN